MSLRLLVLSLAFAAAAALAAGSAEPSEKGGWISDAKGCRVWREELRPALSVSWSGACPHGLADGNGVLAWYQDGQLEGRYEGEMRRGHYHGYGNYIWPSGARYWGEIAAGQREGHGFFAWANGDRYDGGWRNGRREGYGIYAWASGERYEGGWKNDRAEGEGTYRAADGTLYKGRWVRGCLRDGERRIWVAIDNTSCD